MYWLTRSFPKLDPVCCAWERGVGREMKARETAPSAPKPGRPARERRLDFAVKGNPQRSLVQNQAERQAPTPRAGVQIWPQD